MNWFPRDGPWIWIALIIYWSEDEGKGGRITSTLVEEDSNYTSSWRRGGNEWRSNKIRSDEMRKKSRERTKVE